MSDDERALFEGTADTETPTRQRDPWGWRKATLIGVGLVTLGALIVGVLVLIKGDDEPRHKCEFPVIFYMGDMEDLTPEDRESGCWSVTSQMTEEQRGRLKQDGIQDAYPADTPNPNHVSERGLDPRRIAETREALGLPRACDPNTSQEIRDIGFVPCQDNTKEK